MGANTMEATTLIWFLCVFVVLLKLYLLSCLFLFLTSSIKSRRSSSLASGQAGLLAILALCQFCVCFFLVFYSQRRTFLDDICLGFHVEYKAVDMRQTSKTCSKIALHALFHLYRQLPVGFQMLTAGNLGRKGSEGQARSALMELI